MNPLTRRFSSLRRAFVPYLMAGYPDPATFCRLFRDVCVAGADMVEVGIPFSDPLADGPTIQHASERALAHGVTVSQTLLMLDECGASGSTPVVIMSYLNPLLQYGLERFAQEASRVGVRGLIVPDTIVEETAPLERICRSCGIDLVQLLAPTSPPDRQQLILQRTRGFVYLVSVAGVTGARPLLADDLLQWIAHIKSQSPVPVVVGFGISTPEQAARVASEADGVVIGSAIIDIVRHSTSSDAACAEVKAFTSAVRHALDAVPPVTQSPLPSRRI